MAKDLTAAAPRAFVFGILTLLLISDMATLAQDTENEVILEEIIVTARKRTERLQTVPIAVTSLTGLQLEKRSVADLRDIGRFTPNVYYSNIGSASPDQSTVFIRGVGTAEAMITGDPGVGLYFDGVFWGRFQGGTMDLLDIERIEVLRGPQGVLFGKNTIGGAINVISRTPQGDNSGQVSINIGNLDRLDVSGAVDLGLIEDTLSVRLSALSKSRDCLTRRASDGACYGDEDVAAGRAFIRYESSDRFSADLILDATDSNGHSVPHGIVAYNESAAAIASWNADVAAGLIPGPELRNSNPEIASPDPYATEGTLDPVSGLEMFGASLHLQFQSGNTTFHSISSYRDMQAPSIETSDGSAAEMAEVDSYTEADAFSQEFRVEGAAWNDKFDYVAGVYLYLEDGLTDEGIPIPYLFGGFFGQGGWVHLNMQETESYAAFLHSSWSMSEKLRLTAALRYTTEEKDFTGGRRSFNSTTFDQVPLTNTKTDWDAWTPRFGIDYQVNDDLMWYLSASRGFRSGGFNGRSESVLAVSTPFNPEYVWSYEAGIKSEFLNNRVRLNATAYFSDYSDRQQTVLRFTGTTFAPIIANAAEVEIKGFEAELTAQVTPQFRIDANIGYTNGEYTAVDPDVTDISINSPVTFTPEWTAVIGGEFRVPLVNENADLLFRADYTYRDEVFFNPTVTAINSEDSFGLLNARITYTREVEDGEWEMSIYGRNLTDEIYKLWANDLFASPFGLAFAWYSDPREYGFNVTRRF